MRNLTALFLLIAFQLSTPTWGEIEDIYLFMEPAGDAESVASSGSVGSVLKSMLEDVFPQATIRAVAPQQLTLPTVEEYVEQFQISHYLKVSVSSMVGGLLLDFVLVAGEKEKSIKAVTIGPTKKNDPRAIKARLRSVPLLYDAMLHGIDPDNLIYVGCFKVSVDPPSHLLQRNLTLQLPSKLVEITPMKDRYSVSGVEPLEFDRQCLADEVLPQEDLDFMDDFNYIIQGFIEAVDQSIDIPVLVYTQTGTEVLHPPPLSGDTVVEELAKHIATCWNKWDDANCK